MMSGSAILFYIISALLLITAILSVTSKQIFRAAIWLLFSLLGVSALYFWLDLNFLAAVQIVVYVGGIVVLIIFSVFLTRGTGQELPTLRNRRLYISLLSVVVGFVFAAWCLWKYGYQNTAPEVPATDMKSIGQQMLSIDKGGYALPFEMASIFLLAAMIACIAIAMKIAGPQTNDNKN